MPLTQVQSGMMDSVAQYYSFKNRIINGGMNIWQRGTTTVNPAAGASNFYTADRWACNRNSNVTGITVSRSTSAPSGFQYSLALQRVAANTSTADMYIFNSNESINTLDLASHTVTLSFWARAGANYSGGALVIQMLNGTGTDQPVYAYTGSNIFSNTTQAITTTWTRYSVTATVPSNATEMGFYIYWTPTGTAGADDAVYFTGFQLEKGVTATSFDYRPYTTELQLCQRYYWKWVSVDAFAGVATGNADNTNSANAVIKLPVTMRAQPTTSYSTLRIVDGGANPTATSLYATRNSYDAMSVYFGATSNNLVTGRGVVIQANNSTTAFIDASAEL